MQKLLYFSGSKILCLLSSQIGIFSKVNKHIVHNMNLEPINISKDYLSALGIDKYAHIPQENTKEKFQICSLVSFAMDKSIFKHT